jgi:two-component sensor histidine kinase
MGISMVPVENLSWAQVLKKIQKKDLDILPAVAISKERESYLSFTNVYLEIPHMIVTRTKYREIRQLSDLKGEKVAVVKGSLAKRRLERDYPELELVLYDDMWQVMKAVSKGGADALIETIPAFKYELRRFDLDNLRVAAQTPYKYEIAFGVRKDWPELVPILNKKLAEIDKREMELMLEKWANVHVERDLDWQKLLTWIVIVLVVSLFFVGFFVKTNRRLAHEITNRKQAEKDLSIHTKHLEALVEGRTAQLVVLFREVNHRVKNNLMAIISMLHREEELAIKNEVDSQYVDRLNKLVSRINGLLTVHSLLSSSKWRPISITELCDKIIKEFIKGVPFGKTVKYDLSISNVTISSDQAHHLTLVLNELVINTSKYGFKNNHDAQIRIKTYQEGDLLHIIYQDDGLGFPDSILKGDFSEETIGLQLIFGIIEKSLQGNVELKNDNGAITRISFPLLNKAA